MPGGGTLRIRVQPGTLADGTAAVVVDFMDSGTGIAPENMAKIMEPFFTTKEAGKGTGLGLPICRRIVQEHRGVLELTSELGKGTTVRILLPVQNGGNGYHLDDD
jgi:two-component system NtrC family sensor kinase